MLNRFFPLAIGWVFIGAAAVVVADDGASAGRRVIPLNDAWRFHRGEARGADQPGHRVDNWASVELPHTWNARDGQDGGGDYYRGPSWYRRTFETPALVEGGRVFLRIHAANTIADVFLNGHHVGTHQGGFSRFVYELTPRLRKDKPNVLAIKVNNAHTEHVPPFSADFTFFGGLYRGVDLLVTGPLCISPLDYGSSGVYLRQENVSADQADVTIRTLLSNAGDARSVAVQAAIVDADGKEVARVEQDGPVATGASEVAQRVRLADPHLWAGRSDPYLYTVRVQVRDGDAVVDEVEQPLGLRFFHVDPDKGFFLNGRHYDLHGVNRHQDRLNMGWAITLAEHEEDFRMIHEMGCTAVRLAHYQQAPEAYALCDRLGLVVWAEIPLVNRIVDSPAFEANCKQQLRELIWQNYNHPSIVCWGMQNEVTASWQPGPNAAELVGELHELSKAEDPDRLTTLAATGPHEHPANWQTELSAFNTYFGWYWGPVDGIGPWADKMHADHPDTPVGVSEYGAGGSIHHHEWPPKRPQHDGDWHPEEWQTHLHEVHWQAMAERPFLWGKFVWNMFDFAVDNRREGDTAGRNDKGLVTYDRKTRKDAFYWYKVNWAEEPMVYITSRRYTPRTSLPVPVRVYSNCPTVTLFVNNENQGEGIREGKVHIWPNVELKTGRNLIRSIAREDGKDYVDACEWVYQPAEEPAPE